MKGLTYDVCLIVVRTDCIFFFQERGRCSIISPIIFLVSHNNFIKEQQLMYSKQRLTAFLMILQILVLTSSVTYEEPPSVTEVDKTDITMVIGSGSAYRSTIPENVQRISALKETDFYTFTIYEWFKDGAKVYREVTGKGILESPIANFVVGTTEDQSCNQLIGDDGTISFVSYDSSKAADKIMLYSNITFTNGKDATHGGSAHWAQDAASANVIRVGSKCEFIGFNDEIYKLTGTANVSSTMDDVTVPTGFAFQAVSESFQYLVSGNKLYKYTSSSNSYSELYDLGADYNHFHIRQKGDIIVVLAEELNGTRDYLKGTLNASDPTIACNRVDTFTNCTEYLFLRNFKLFIFADNSFKLISSETFNGQTLKEHGQKLLVSEDLTRVGFVYVEFGSNFTLKSFFRKVDHTAKTVANYNFAEEALFNSMLETMDLDKEIAINENFIFIKNSSGYAKNVSLPTYEIGYQFLFEQIVHLRTYDNSGSATLAAESAMAKLWIDPSSATELQVAKFSDAVAAAEVVASIKEDSYGSLKTNKRIKTSSTGIPIITSLTATSLPLRTEDTLAWTYAVEDTNYDVEVMDVDPTTLVKTLTTFSLTGTGWIIKENHRYCKSFWHDTDKNLHLYAYNTTSTNFELKADITNAIVVNQTAFDISLVFISEDCNTIAYGEKFYFWNTISNQFSMVALAPLGITNLAIKAVTKDMSYFLSVNATNTSEIHLYSFDSQSKDIKMVTNVTLEANATAAMPLQVHKYNDRVLVRIDINHHSLVSVYKITNEVASTIYTNNDLNGTSSNSSHFDTIKFFQFSPQLTELFVHAYEVRGAASNTTVTDLISLDYTAATFKVKDVSDTITTPTDFYHLTLGQGVIVTTNTDSTTSDDIVYSYNVNLDLKKLNKRVYDYALSATHDHLQTLLIHVGQEISVYNTFNDVTFNIELWVGSKVDASSLPEDVSTLGVQFVDGKVKTCAFGCLQCSDTGCSSCDTGYYLDTNAAQCKSCSSDCVVCTAAACTTCVTGFFIQDGACSKCGSTCLTCSSLTVCDTCLTSHFINASNTNQCDPCPVNCLDCDASGVCTSCKAGFAINATSGSCVGCFITCSVCDATDTTVCLSCSKGLWLNNGICEQCPSNCVECTSATQCTTCSKGYHIGSTGDCVSDCEFPCLNCYDNRPTVCKSCYFGAKLSGTKCVIDSDCNSNNSCTYCGVGFNYILVVDQCLSCTGATANCLQVSASSCDVCDECDIGYYKSDMSCLACPTQCAQCSTNDTCTQCSVGYHFPNEITQGMCQICTSPCKTCQSSSTQCLTCVSGYTKVGWKCQNNNHVAFTIVFDATVDQIKVLLVDISETLLTAMNESTTRYDLITVASLETGSAILSGTATSDTLTADQAGAAIATSASSMTPGGYTVTSSTVTVNGKTVNQSQEETDVVPIIAGVIGGVALIVIIIVAVYCYKKKHENEVHAELRKEDSVMVIQH